MSDLSSGANSAAPLNNNGGNTSGSTDNGGNNGGNQNHATSTPTSPSSVKSRKSPIESKAQKPSFLSLIFCCGANFVNDSDASLQVGPTRSSTVTIGNGPGKKVVTGNPADEKVLPAQPAATDAEAGVTLEDNAGVSVWLQCPQSLSEGQDF